HLHRALARLRHILQPPAGGGGHRRRGVDRDHPPVREPLQQRRGDAPRATARIEHHLIACQLQPGERFAAQRLHRGGDPIVAGAIPLTRPWHTSVRYHVCPSCSISRDSAPPCPAIGDAPSCP